MLFEETPRSDGTRRLMIDVFARASGAIIHPMNGDDPQVYVRETITMLERYLRGGEMPAERRG